MKRKKICGRCGSNNLVFDSWAVWNPDSDQFELDQVFENAFCIECDSNTTEKDEEIEE